MRIIFMGTPDFAVATLEALVRAGHEIPLVVTQPDRPRGRHGALQKSEVRLFAEAQGIPVITPERLRQDTAAQEKLREIAPELIAVTAFGQILPREVLEIPRYGCINVHASLLPKYRGASPIQWAVLNGDERAGVTTMMMDVGLDDGDILEQASIPLDKRETGGSLFRKLAPLGGELLVKTIADLEAGTMPRTPQNALEATKVGMFTKQSGRIDWSESAERIERMVRGLNPWPSAFTELRGRQLKLWETELADSAALSGEDVRCCAALPGNGSLYTDGRVLYARCGEGVLRILELQLEGKKRMRTEEFLRGYQF